MALSYANIQDRAEMLLQDTGNATYDTTELGYWIEDELKRISRKRPLYVDVVFQIESRRGTDVTGTASTLTDATKSQFLSTDDDDEKVVHNTTDDTWATIISYTSTSIVGLSRDIIDANEKYEIYNKRCRNKRQIYIGDMPSMYRKVVSVEYPIGTERNFVVLDDVVELLVEDNTILDSDSTLSNLNPVDVLVRFSVPQLLSQLTDWAGEIDLGAGYSEGDTTIHVDGLGTTETIEAGEQFHIENLKELYIVTTAVTLSSGEGDVVFYPPLEADISDGDDVTFRKSTLSTELEEILCQRVAARAVLSNTIIKLDASNKGGTGAYERERKWAMDILDETDKKLTCRPVPHKTLPRT